MGREIRMVPPNWQHPVDGTGSFIPLEEEDVKYPEDIERTWYQVYETVSAGKPVTPPFATKDELVMWLVNKGERHGTQYERRFSIKQADAFVEAGYAPSFMMMVSEGKITAEASGIEIPLTLRPR